MSSTQKWLELQQKIKVIFSIFYAGQIIIISISMGHPSCFSHRLPTAVRGFTAIDTTGPATKFGI